MARLIIVAQRLPITARIADGVAELTPSAGGVATGLARAHEHGDGVWIGWPGPLDGLDADGRAKLARDLAKLRLAAVALTPEEERGSYESYANGLLWPLFHYETNLIPPEVRDFDLYLAANQRFADTVVAAYRPGDIVWIHDYQLFLVPKLVREQLPDARIGFFLHIPFPSSEVFRILPNREAILEGLLAADLIGFHTAAYMRHFVSSVQRVLGTSAEIDYIRWKGRRVQLGVFPMGVDAKAFAAEATETTLPGDGLMLERRPDEKILLGIDRLDYTKGIPRRLLAYERLLESHPELRGHVRFVQVAVPSREGVEAYQTFRSKADELIGRIHGRFATPEWVPIHWIYRHLELPEIVALYRTADVMLVTPLRDGMNLVAKEYIASRVDERGVLVLSEFAGAASELAEAVSVNPFDVETTAEAYYRALIMPDDEMQRRMSAMRKRVFAFDTHRWVARFVAALDAIQPAPEEASEKPSAPDAVEAAKNELLSGSALVAMLDYDGTLQPLERTPELAAPDAEIRGILLELSRRPATEVHVVSGRSADNLEAWLGDLPIGLHGEHGIQTRPRGAAEWEAPPHIRQEWRAPVIKILQEFAGRTPGSLVEDKGACVAWHYRATEPEFGASQARELRLHLLELLSNEPVEILAGHKVIEVRPQGFHKGRIVGRVLAKSPPDAKILAMGDDNTDEDLFAALPPEAISIRVGPGPSRAKLRLATVADARAFLASLLPAA